MIIYFSPGTGKTKFCKEHPEWIDGDNILAEIISKHIGQEIHGEDLHRTILPIYNKNRDALENCYTEYKDYLMQAKINDIKVLYGTRRFMWLADMIFIEDEPNVIQRRGRQGTSVKDIDYLLQVNIYERLKGRYVFELFDKEKNIFVYTFKSNNLEWLKDKLK
jgi:hypothetical protein